MMREPVSRHSKYSSYYLNTNQVSYNLNSPLYSAPDYFTFPCKGFLKGPATQTINGNQVQVTLEGTATHGGGHCQFGISYDDNTFLVLKVVFSTCLLDSMSYQFELPPGTPSGDTTVFWSWINRIGNREYYMECADVNIQNGNTNRNVNLPGKELIVANILNYPVIPEFASPQAYDGADLFQTQKSITINPSQLSVINSKPNTSQNDNPNNQNNTTNINGNNNGNNDGNNNVNNNPNNNVLYESGETFGTYYYDLKTNCPGEPNGYAEVNGYPFCTSNTNPQTLRKYNTNNLVAIARNLFDTYQLCGKKVLVYRNGVPVTAPDGGSFFVGDACEACNSDGHIDFSVSGILNVDGNACTLGKVPGVSFKILNEQIFDFAGLPSLVPSVTPSPPISSPPPPIQPPSPAAPHVYAPPPVQSPSLRPPTRIRTKYPSADCTTGYMKCEGKGYAICDYGKWINLQCGIGTKCKQNGNYILCDFDESQPNTNIAQDPPCDNQA
jgi:hypothetical protein